MIYIVDNFLNYFIYLFIIYYGLRYNQEKINFCVGYLWWLY